jgi:hypothetical protein
MQKSDTREEENSDEEVTKDTRTCVYSWQCLRVDVETKDARYQLVFCSVECQTRYQAHRERNWPHVTADVVDEQSLIAEFQTLWKLHVSLTRQLIVATARAEAGGEQLLEERLEKQGITEAMKHNHMALGRLFGVTYGNLFGDEITRQMTEHTHLTARVAFELAQLVAVNKKPMDSDMFKLHNDYYDEWREQALDMARFLCDRISAGMDEAEARDGVMCNNILHLMRKHIDVTLAEMIDEVNGARQASHEDYAQAQVNIDHLAHYVEHYMETGVAKTMREFNRRFYGLWRRNALTLCHWLKLLATESTAERELQDAEAELRDTMKAIAIEGFLAKYGEQLPFSLMFIYADWLQKTRQLVARIIAMRRNILRVDQSDVTAMEVYGREESYAAWVETLNDLVLLLEDHVVPTEGDATASKVDGHTLRQHFAALGLHALGLVLDTVNAWMAASDTEKRALQRVTDTEGEEEDKCEAIVHQCVKIADHLLAYMDE